MSNSLIKEVQSNKEGERSEFESPDGNVFSEGLEEEESKMSSMIPVIKTNIKEGRMNLLGDANKWN